MELRRYVGIVGRWWWLIVLSVVIAAASSYLASRAAIPIYRTKTTLVVGRVTQNPQPNSTDLYTGQQLAYTYSQLARREPVLKGVLKNLGLSMGWEDLAKQVNAAAIPQTQLLEINVIDTDPYRAKLLADAIAQQLILLSPSGSTDNDQGQIAFTKAQLDDLKSKIVAAQAESLKLKKELDVSNSSREILDLQNQIDILDKKITDWQDTYSRLLITIQGGDINALNVIEEASVPTTPISPNINMNVLLASVIGLVLAIGGILVIEYLDDTIKTSDDVTRTLNLTVIGTIGFITGKDSPERLVIFNQPLSPVVEMVHALQINIQALARESQVKTIVFSSTKPGEGKSLTLSNLAVMMATSGLKVVVLDADLRMPVLHHIFNLPNDLGLSDVLNDSGSLDVQNYLKTTNIENLRILLSGNIPQRPAETLGSKKMQEVLVALEDEADFILIDTPPVLSVADTLTLGTFVDGVVFLVLEGSTRRNEARRAIEELRAVNINILGVVLRRKKGHQEGYSYYHYYSSKKGHKENTVPGMSSEYASSRLRRLFRRPRKDVD